MNTINRVPNTKIQYFAIMYKKILVLLVLCMVKIHGSSNMENSNSFFFISFSTTPVYGEQLHEISNEPASIKYWSYYPYINNIKYPPQPSLNLVSYLLVDINSAYILANYNEKRIHSTASLAKLMTAYIVFKEIESNKLSLDERFEIRDNTIFKKLPFNSSRMGLQIGDNPSIDELLRGLFVVSGNDAAILLANIVHGSEAAFVRHMNLQASILGLYDTKFSDSSGLSPQNVSTAQDLAKLANMLFQFTTIDVIEYSSIPNISWHRTKGSTNLLLGNYKGINGLKTGYIEEAGFNFIASAERKVLDNTTRRLLVVVLGARGKSISEGVVNRAEAAKILLNYGYTQFEYVIIDYKAQEVEVWGAKQDNIILNSLVTRIILPKEWSNSLYTNIQIPQFIWSPIEKNEILGRVDIYNSNVDDEYTNVLSSIHLISPVVVDKANWFIRIADYFKMVFISIFQRDKL